MYVVYVGRRYFFKVFLLQCTIHLLCKQIGPIKNGNEKKELGVGMIVVLIQRAHICSKKVQHGILADVGKTVWFQIP